MMRSAPRSVRADFRFLVVSAETFVPEEVTGSG